jgi:hypothetical protein
MELISAPTIS